MKKNSRALDHSSSIDRYSLSSSLYITYSLKHCCIISPLLYYTIPSHMHNKMLSLLLSLLLISHHSYIHSYSYLTTPTLSPTNISLLYTLLLISHHHSCSYLTTQSYSYLTITTLAPTNISLLSLLH